MSKIILNNVVNLENEDTAVTTINNNSSTVQTAFDNTLSRDGTAPNQMGNLLDMNSNPIINLPAPTSSYMPLRLIDAQTLNGGGTIITSPLPVGGTTGQVLTKNSNTNYDVIWQTVSGGGGSGTVTSQIFNTRSAVIATVIPTAVLAITIAGYSTGNDGGGGNYTKLLSIPGTIRNWHVQSADGSWWQLVASPVYPRQVGAVIDGVTDDTVAIQAWVDYSATFGVVATDQTGVSIIPTGTITMASGTTIVGNNLQTFRKTSDTVAPLFYSTGTSNIKVSGINIDTTSGFQSTSSNTIGLTTMVFAIPTNRVGLVVGNYVQITSISSPLSYMIAQINSYSGGVLNVTASAAVGSGTYANWNIDSYPISGNLAPGNRGLSFITCNNLITSNNVITGRWYHALDFRNCNNVLVNNNNISGYVNRGIASQAYNSQGALNVVICNNALDGTINGVVLANYGIVIGTASGGSCYENRVYGNRITNTTGDGITMGGNVVNSSIFGNQIRQSTNTANCILVTPSDGVSPQYLSVYGNNCYGGAYGVFLTDAVYINIEGNVIVASGSNGIIGSGTKAGGISWCNIVNNTISSATSHGINLSGAVSSAIVGINLTGNTVVASGGWGFISNGTPNVTTVLLSGNISQANTSGNYAIAGSTSATGGNI